VEAALPSTGRQQGGHAWIAQPRERGAAFGLAEAARDGACGRMRGHCRERRRGRRLGEGREGRGCAGGEEVRGVEVRAHGGTEEEAVAAAEARVGAGTA
jgi:hypothetical protein